MAKHSPSGSSRDIDSSIKITDNLIVESEVAIESHKNIKVTRPYYQIKHNVEDQFQSPVQVNTSLYLATH